MKKHFLLIALITLSLASFGQANTATSVNFWPFTWSRPHQSDSVQINAIALTSQNITSIIWSEDSLGTNFVRAMLAPSATWRTSLGASSSFWVKGATLGPHRYTAIVTLADGTSSMTKDSIYVVADPVCPVCPTCPTLPAATARITSWNIVQVGGIGRIQVSYWDGLTALLP